MPDELTGHHLLLYQGDFNRLRELHPHASPTSIVRGLVRKHILELNEKGPSEVDKLKEFV